MTPNATGNALADQPVIVYNEDGSINRESFGRDLSRLERALCDAHDKLQKRLDGLYAAGAPATPWLNPRG